MSEFEFSFGSAKQGTPARRRKGVMRILVMANYCGAQNRSAALNERKPLRVDIDSFSTVMKRFAPTAAVQHGDTNERIRGHSLEDFEPDALFTRLECFDALRQSRKDIKAGKVSDEFAPQQTPNNGSESKEKPDSDDESIGDTVSRLLGDTTATTKAKPKSGLLDSFIAKLSEDDAAPDSSGSQSHLDACDAAISEVMRAVLHDDSLKSVEAIWRGLYDLINSIESDEAVEVFILDVSRDEIAQDLLTGDRQNSALVTTLVEQGVGSFGGQAWDYLVGDYHFTPNDAELIAGLGAVAQAAGGTWLTDINIDSLDQDAEATWTALRNSPSASSIVLTTPRVLMRPPYGKQFDAPDLFGFEECQSEPDNTELVWGSSALLVATCLAQQAEAGVARGNLSDQSIAQNRPMFSFDKDGTKALQAVAETFLSDSQAEQLREQWGVMPIRAERNGNRLLFPALQSLATR